MEERLQKYMARAGVASRRRCEVLIAEGRVAVNSQTVSEPGVKIDPERDHVTVDGKPAPRPPAPVYLMLHKPADVTTTASDELGRRTVMDLLPRDLDARVYPVGRLDRDSEGLLILTNDGDLAYHLTHPARGVVKTYRVTVEGKLKREVAAELPHAGIRLGPVLVKPRRVEILRADENSTALMVSVAEGINREVRRMFAAMGHEVKRLVRVQVGPLSLKGLKRGAYRELAPGEISALRRDMGDQDPARRLAEERAAFPPDSAASRKPQGPRGRAAGRSDRPRPMERPGGRPDSSRRPADGRTALSPGWAPRKPQDPRDRAAGRSDRLDHLDRPRPAGRQAGRGWPAGRQNDWRRGKPDPARRLGGRQPFPERFGRSFDSNTLSGSHRPFGRDPARPAASELPTSRVYPAGNPHAPGGPPKRKIYVREYYRETANGGRAAATPPEKGESKPNGRKPLFHAAPPHDPAKAKRRMPAKPFNTPPPSPRQRRGPLATRPE